MQFDAETIQNKLDLLGTSFKQSLNLSDEDYLNGIADRKGTLEQLLPFKNWDWTQGVGLYGFWRLYKLSGKRIYRDQIVEYYDRYINDGLPGKNINSICPMLTMAFLWEESRNDAYLPYLEEWTQWIMTDLPKTEEGGFQHITAEYENHQELWADTVFMALLFLAKMGKLLDRDDYIKEAEYQFVLHIKYLTDRETGLLFHGWTFLERNHFASALWCRGNCWLTMAIPVFMEICDPSPAVRRFLTVSLNKQIEGLCDRQAENGLWHTLLDQTDSYLEISGSAGIATGIMMAARLGLIPPDFRERAFKGFDAFLDNIDDDGRVLNVSIGTPMGRTDSDFYKNIELAPMPYGQALMMLYLIEILETLSI